MLSCYILCLCTLPILVYGQGVTVDTEYGQVRGGSISVYNGRIQTKVDSFYGIPYAKETSGPRRFASPEPPDAWEDILEADELGDACPQSMGTLGITHPGWDRFSEDCLHLNIFSPDVSGGPYPVMFWIYGGGYQTGTNFQYPGHFLATHGVVVVTVNYRLNKFGFAYTGNAAAPGNAGLWDQRAGLQFVINNIANFGGDPSLITVFGESAGASSASLQMLSPQSKDLFQQAIMQSGADTSPWSYISPDRNPENSIRNIAAQLDCNRTDDFDMIDCLRQLPWEEIHVNSSGGGFSAVVDGPGGFLPLTPEELRESEDIMRGPIISGFNHDDSAYFLPGFVPEVIFGCCNRTYFMRLLRDRFVGLLFNDLDNVTQEDIVQAMAHNYSPWPYKYNNWLNRDALIKLTNDAGFGMPCDRQLKHHSTLAPSYGFVYNYRGRNSTQLFPEWMGVPHIAEIPYVWGHTLLPVNEEVRNNSQIHVDLVDWTEEDVEHTVFLQTLWTNFAKFGNPTPVPVDNPLGGSTVWPEFTFDEMRTLVISNVSIVAEDIWRQRDYAFWEEYMPYIIGESAGDKADLEMLESWLENGLDLSSLDDLFNYMSAELPWLLEARRQGDVTYLEELDVWW